MRHHGKFVPSSTITARMDRKDRRFQASARAQLGLAPEIVPYASVEIVREVAIVPATPDAPLAPVVTISLVKTPRFTVRPLPRYTVESRPYAGVSYWAVLDREGIARRLGTVYDTFTTEAAAIVCAARLNAGGVL